MCQRAKEHRQIFYFCLEEKGTKRGRVFILFIFMQDLCIDVVNEDTNWIYQFL